ncbi:hypothetical protein ACIQXG_19510 [Lysinibacillus sphaericus]|uniref:hypothetical protein n=1 Tax=Lysinibacillus sphaericus TaxID=1421 RepID=UPI0038056426
MTIKDQIRNIESLEFDLFEQKLSLAIEKAYQQGVEDGRSKYGLKALMTRKEFMNFAGIGETKCAELFNRRDFPVNREFGHPRVPTQLLLEWINANTDWVRANAPKVMHLYKAI